MQRDLRPRTGKRSYTQGWTSPARPRGSAPAYRRIREVSRMGAVRKAVFPVAGLDTRFLPATKAAPKEMLTVVDKPLIHYAVEEAISAGIREMVFVTTRHKRSIEDHFDRAYDLEESLEQECREELLAELRRLFPSDVRYLYVRQREHGGLGAALRSAHALLEDAPFAVIVPDELIDAPTPAIGQLMASFASLQQPVVGVRPATSDDAADETVRTGMAFCERTHHVVRFERVERPAVGQLIPVGRYVLTPAVFDYLDRHTEGNGEPALHAALRELAAEHSLLAYEVEGERFACGTKLGLLAANVHYGLKHPDLAMPFADLLQRVQLTLQRQAPRFTTSAPRHAESELLGSPRA
jgi:UTP--glucose-1-phosphate uridylyltransferase